MTRFTLAAVAFAALAATPAFAQPPAGGEGPLRRADVEQQLKDQFARLDANHDGVLTREEAAADGSQRGPGGPGVRGGAGGPGTELFDRLDTNHDGMLSRDEFAALRTMFRGGGGGGFGGGSMLGRNWFDRVDANHDGKVTLDEMMKTALGSFDRVDANHDGVITPEEREAFVRTMRARQQQPGGEQQQPDGQ